MRQLKIKVNEETFTIKVKDLDVRSNYNVSVNVYNSKKELICGWHDKHTKSKEDIKEDVLSHLSSNNDLIIL